MEETKENLRRDLANAVVQAATPQIGEAKRKPPFGMAETEAEIVAGIEAAREELRQGRGIPHAEAMKHIRDTIAREAKRGKPT